MSVTAQASKAFSVRKAGFSLSDLLPHIDTPDYKKTVQSVTTADGRFIDLTDTNQKLYRFNLDNGDLYLARKGESFRLRSITSLNGNVLLIGKEIDVLIPNRVDVKNAPLHTPTVIPVVEVEETPPLTTEFAAAVAPEEIIPEIAAADLAVPTAEIVEPQHSSRHRSGHLSKARQEEEYKALLGDVFQGNLESLGHYFNKMRPIFMRRLTQRFRIDDGSAEDIISDVQCNIIEMLAKKDVSEWSSDNLSAYIARSISNMAMDHFRHLKTHNDVSLDTVGAPDEDSPHALSVDWLAAAGGVMPDYGLWGQDPMRAASLESTINALYDYLAKHPQSPANRLIEFIDALHSGQVSTAQEYAALTGVDRGTISATHFRARAALQKAGIFNEFHMP